MKKCLILLACVLFLTSCASTRTLVNVAMTYYDQEWMAENRMEEILDAIQEQDKEAIKDLFSTNTLNESDDMDGDIDNLFDFYEGTVESYELRNPAPTPIRSQDHGKLKIEYFAWYIVDTDQETYTFFFYDYPVDNEYPDNEGLCSLWVVKENQTEEYLGDYEIMKTPGLYVPK